jgi:hypothetical protein
MKGGARSFVGREWQTANLQLDFDIRSWCKGEGFTDASGLSCFVDRSTCCHGAKGAKLPLKFYVKAAGNVSSVKTEKARRVQQQYFGMHNGCVFAQS